MINYKNQDDAERMAASFLDPSRLSDHSMTSAAELVKAEIADLSAHVKQLKESPGTLGDLSPEDLARNMQESLRSMLSFLDGISFETPDALAAFLGWVQWLMVLDAFLESKGIPGLIHEEQQRLLKCAWEMELIITEKLRRSLEEALRDYESDSSRS